jgi:hypothetical protein
MDDIVNAGVKMGPNHTEHLKLEASQAAFVKDGQDLVGILESANSEYEDNMRILREKDLLPLEDFIKANDKRKAAFRTFGSDINGFINYVDDEIVEPLFETMRAIEDDLDEELRNIDDEGFEREHVAPLEERFRTLMGSDGTDDKPSEDKNGDDEPSSKADAEGKETSKADKEDQGPGNDKEGKNSPSEAKPRSKEVSKDDKEEVKSPNDKKGDQKPSRGDRHEDPWGGVD